MRAARYYGGYLALRLPTVQYEELVLAHAAAMGNLTAAVARALGVANASAPASVPSQTGAAKPHGSSRDWFEAKEYVAAHGWLAAYSAADLSRACAELNATLLRRFGYETCLQSDAAREETRRRATERRRRRRAASARARRRPWMATSRAL